ncbi:MAG: PilT/PilU family type 4a pilus ATPase [Lentisphaerae bacterium]|jgi:pilus retraction protein PilT|nr:PilT/PilU family type 4a pilus ATPase [Lentisphaerota bacterium]MBT4814381.1 PilT/PilU family type 4a pilus ATPase [Lentisphaerota bacterium]MBT5608929.1 PilT/PilU family type 4a pilus ATPase [Lentisphaerota bacterium]MBT7055588.1 PilT/PilU family type 4a pilus ATPase [Lentisphaerota bacterium]MBT7845547.1 PilT/PilU family type 4a pilus ATPase [Lentisphaerota bacterium]
MTVVDLLQTMDAQGASDLFLTAGKPPCMRIMGQVERVGEEPIAAEDIWSFLGERLPAGVRERFDAERDLDIGISLSETDRFRLNLFFQKGQVGMAVRRVPSGALSFSELQVPPVVQALAERPRGLVLITGATGSGKSTTMAAMLHHINTRFHKHVVTIEDPIEYVHRDVKSVVSQREIGNDTLDFAAALKHVVRQNPDVIFIGEMRDLETIQTAISAAMTGHLVVSTVHTVDVAQSLERVINYFPASLRDQVAQDFSVALEGIVSQRLLPRKDGKGRVPVFETLVATPRARRVIAGRQLEDIEEVLKAGSSEGMQTFTRSLVKCYEDDLVAAEAAAAAATNREEFLLAIQGMETGIDTLRRGQTGSSEQPELAMDRLLRNAVRLAASDLLLTVGSPPMLRLGGELRELDTPPLTGADTQKLLFSVLTPAQRAHFESEKEIDFALSVSDRAREDDDRPTQFRFRVNGFYQKGCIACSLRLVPQTIPDPEQLGIPAVVMDLAKRMQGLVLVTGPTGHGKSTTLACMVDYINRTRACHIITVEDPIELVHTSKKAVVEQREVFADTKSFASALKYVLRQDPDVILVGEMRDRETISAALTAAETGHLVFATLHTNDCAQTVDRIIDTFPGDRQSQIRSQLAACIEGVVAQRLLPKKGEPDERVAAFEIMLGTIPVKTLVREQRTHQLPATIETGAKDGMVTMDKSLLELYNRDLISRQIFKAVAKHPSAI